MLNTPAALAPGMPAPLSPSGAPGPAPQGADDGRAFAQALDRAAASQRGAASEAAATKQRETTTPESREAAEPDADSALAAQAGRPDTAAARPAVRATPLNKVLPLAATAASATAAAAGTAAAPGEASSGLAGAAVTTRADTESNPARPDAADTTAPELAAWVSGLPLPPPRPAAAGAAAQGAMSTPTATAAPDSVAAGRPEPAAGLRPGQDGALPPAAPLALPASPDTPRQADARHGRGMPPAVNEPAGKELLAMPGSDATARAPSALRDTPAGQRAGGDGAPTTAALPPAWALAAARGADPAATLQAELRPPVGSQEFAPALGSQLSVMVRNGVEHAQLRLNPAEMGPIEVRIVLDGTQAQIDFSAAHALTRQALQEAVPALASALRESGLTLSGGGVFQQAREQRGDPRDDGPRQGGRTYGGGGELPAPAVPAPRSARTRGVVDLYA